MSEWQSMDTAPRDGSMIDLTWMDNDRPQEIYPMCWNQFAENQIVQRGKGIWAIHSKTNGALLMTWCEQDPDGAPTHWRMHDPAAFQ